ncbi:S41 family peptidase, partial [Chitinophaga sp.]|uniref:S41 family peptidase n=1 Tax=Chitinophaga sp. TaxID=1869181 RepID=UPI002F94CA52
LAVLIACRKKDDPPAVPTGPVTQSEINQWILDSMHVFYLWNDQLPGQANESLEPQAFFNGIKSNEDKFSLIYNPTDPATIKSDMLYKYGVDFSIIDWPAATGGVIGVVKLVVPGSYAAAGGLKRGDYFTRINETLLTTANSTTLPEQLRIAADGGSITPAVIKNNAITEGPLVQLHPGKTTENPVYKSIVINSGNKKVGYLFYNAFTDGHNNYLLSAFQDFKTKGINDLVIDLRYNVGGSLAAAAMMTAMIAPGITEKSIFVKYSGNNKMGTRTLDFATTLSVPETGGAIAFSSLLAGQLKLPRVFIISGRQTVSAAELLINNLKPYTQVIQIGQTTVGKDKGAVIVYDMRTPQRIPWIIHPLTYRLSNANGAGNYTAGIAPQYPIDEMSQQPLLPLGNTDDLLLAKALSVINGNVRTRPENNVPASNSRYDARRGAAMNSVIIFPK